MKVFKFDPITGKRGELLGNVKRASWTAEFLPDNGIDPIGFGKDSDVTVHRNAGITGRDGGDISYKRDEWTCFCLGCWHMGVGDDGRPEERWQWIILPPKS